MSLQILLNMENTSFLGSATSTLRIACILFEEPRHSRPKGNKTIHLPETAHQPSRPWSSHPQPHPFYSPTTLPNLITALTSSSIVGPLYSRLPLIKYQMILKMITPPVTTTL